MGMLVDGVWQDVWYNTKASGGRFIRSESQFRNWVGTDAHPAAAGRYHLYVSLACPWAHRTLIYRKLKGLEAAIDVSVVSPLMADRGWSFETDAEATGDKLFGYTHMHQVYTRAKADYSGRVTVPVLWDKTADTIVSNESAEIIRMLNTAFDGPENGGGNPAVDLYPADLQAQIDEINGWIYEAVNNGVYRSGFATTQEAHEEAFDALFDALDRIDGILAAHRYLLGERITEADWRLFPTLVRFDPVYVGHFKTNLRRIADYPHLSGYLRELYQWPGIKETVSLDHIKRHYYASHRTINPTLVVPKGPALDLDAPHGRDHLKAAA